MHKLKWVNNQYVKALDLDQVVELTLPHLQKQEKSALSFLPRSRNGFVN